MSDSPLPDRPLDSLLTYLRLDERNTRLRRSVVDEAVDSGRWDVARQVIDEGLCLDPGNGELLGLSGFVFLQARRHKEAEQALLTAIEQGVETPELRYNLAFAHFMQRQFAAALAQLARGDVCGTVPGALLLKARCLHHLGDLEEAIADCSSHLSRVPDDADGHGLLALLFLDRADHDRASVHARVALERSRVQCEAMFVNAALLQAAREMDAAAMAYGFLLETHPDCGRGWLGRALLNMERLRVEDARQDAEMATRHMPAHIGSWHVLGWALILQGETRAAENAFHRSLPLDRGFAETHGGLAVVAAMQGRDAEAGASIRRARGLAPQVMSARYAEFVLLRNSGQEQAARDLFEAFLDHAAPGGEASYRELLVRQMQEALGGDAPTAGARILH